MPLHVLAIGVGLVSLVVLVSQLAGRIRRGLAGGGGLCAGDFASNSSSPLLPVAAPGSPGGPPLGVHSDEASLVELAPWSSLAVAELFVASYTALWFAAPGSAAAHTRAAEHASSKEARSDQWHTRPLTLLLGSPSAAHTIMLVAAALLVLAAARRAAQIVWWRRQIAVAAAGVPIAPKGSAPPAKGAVAASDKGGRAGARVGGRVGVKTPSKGGGAKARRGLFPSRCLELLWCTGCCTETAEPSIESSPPARGRSHVSGPRAANRFVDRAAGRRAMV